MRAVVIGAGGAIGNALVKLISRDARYDEIHACSRTARPTSQKIIGHQIDITNELSIRDLFTSLTARGSLERVIVTTGLLHDGEDIQPEKSLHMLDPAILSRLFHLNCIGPAIIAKYALPALNRTSRSIFAVLSARVGSISDNKLGGWYGYRMSKAALNMFIKNAAIETKRSNPHAVVIGLHPGTVDSRLSKPYQSRIDPKKIFSAERAAKQLDAVMEGTVQSQSGSLLSWNGDEILP
jgi:NAD(P)-dependent dehydrogenase (short-subunit alcohol dehydrogenase family)